MKISFGAAVKDRSFGKAIRRVWSKFDGLKEECAKLVLTNPIYSNLIIGFTDDGSAERFEIVHDNDGVFEVVVGIVAYDSDHDLIRQILLAIDKALRNCGFSRIDYETVEIVLAKWRSLLLR